MERLEAIGMLEAKLACIMNETSGTDPDCNAAKCDDCILNYAQGNMGQQKEYINMAIEALEDIYTIAATLDIITNFECCTYGFDDAVKAAMKWEDR